MRCIRQSTAGTLVTCAAVWLGSTGLLEAQYTGGAALFSLDRVSVVYPSGRDDDAALRRDSAEARAAYLEREYGVEAEVVSDQEISQAQLEGNLLLLGWSNRLLRPRDAESLIVKTGDGRRLLGEIPILEGEDLILSHASPYNPEKHLFFWSRIDPERDRLVALPFVGSDWAVYRDFLVLHQGMFSRKPTWPPVRDRAAEMNQRGQLRPLPVQQRSTHYILHHSGNTITPEEAARILEARESALARTIKELGEPSAGFGVDLYVYQDREAKKRLTGVTAPSHSLPSRREMHMTRKQAASASPREEVPLVANERFGSCRVTALCDGLPVSVVMPSDAGGLPLYAAQLLERSGVPAIRDLLDNEGMRELTRRRQGMAASGLFVSWLRTEGGLPLLAWAYSQNRLGVDEIARRMDRDPAEIDTMFASWVASEAERGRSELEFRRADVEARARQRAGDSAGELAALKHALEIKPDDPEMLYRLALAQVDSGTHAEEAQGTLERLVRLRIEPRESRYVVFGHYQLGKLLESLGKPEEAAAQYRQMLDLPDEYDAHRLAREALGEEPE